MRIISGEYKSRKIYSDSTARKLRPASDKTRETLFNILAHRIELDGLKCLDLFSGTGAYGFEAISRGASSCDFVDVSGKALEVIRRTAEELGCSGRVHAIKADSLGYIINNSVVYDIIFADPPYDSDKYIELIGLVLKKNFKVFVLECSKRTLQELSGYNQINEFKVIDKIIGRTSLKFFFRVN